MFAKQETDILKSLVNCIIPADDYPDGWSAGVGDYLLGQFKGDLSDSLPIYKEGLSALDAEAELNFEQSFVDLSSDEQIALLTNIEAGKVKSEGNFDLTAFFIMVIDHSQEGFYSNPENGGNRDSIAWQMIGFEVTA